MFAWVVDRRDKAHAAEKEQFYKSFFDFETRIEKEIKEMSLAFTKQGEHFADLKLQYAVNQNEMKHLQKEFGDYVRRINRIVEKHELKFDNIGKVIDLSKTKA